MHKWAWVMAVSLNYCTPLHLSLKFCNRFNRQKQENDKIKFWKSVPIYVIVRKYQWRKKIIFIPSIKWENLKKNVLFYRQQIAYTQAADLTKHILFHSVEKPVTCNLGPKWFKQARDLKKHQHSQYWRETCEMWRNIGTWFHLIWKIL